MRTSITTVCAFGGSLGPLHARRSLAHLADDPGRDPLMLQLPLDAVGIEAADDHHETDAAVEDRVHLRLLDVAELLQPGENRRHRPTAALEKDAFARRQHAR